VDPNQEPEVAPPDTGLRTMLKWTLVALVAAVLFSAIGVYVTIRVFDHAP
jgi:hypothetical protein